MCCSIQVIFPVQSSTSSNHTIAKLLEADADLAAQEVKLSAQLQSVQQKRQSLKTVIDMFAPAHTTDPVPVATPAQTLVAQEQPQLTTSDVAVLELSGVMPDITTSEAPEAPTPQKQKAKKNSSPNSTGQSKKSAPTGKQSKATDTWQQYVKDEFSNASLAEAVAQVMQQHEKKVLEIATILDAIFTNDIPKEVRSTARERISNVLSVGAKNGKWYRGQQGKYSMSQGAINL